MPAYTPVTANREPVIPRFNVNAAVLTNYDTYRIEKIEWDQAKEPARSAGRPATIAARFPEVTDLRPDRKERHATAFRSSDH